MSTIKLTEDTVVNVVNDMALFLFDRVKEVVQEQSLVSGRYERREWGGFGRPGPATTLEKQLVETVRLDVDGWYPQAIVSGTYSNLFFSVDWIANQLKEISPGVWEGQIVRLFGDGNLMPHKKVLVQVPRTYVPRAFGAKMTITFSEGAPAVTRVLEYASPYFRTAEFEYDRVEGAAQVMSLDTGAHPERPSALRKEKLTITEVYSRLGVEVLQSPNISTVPLSQAGDDLWNNQELNDAMYRYWSRYKSRAQWAAWLLFAGRHEDPEAGGFMFDYSNGPYQRQGCAVFSERLAEMMPSSEAHPNEWIRRNRFFAAVHELGHCFNLNHSWQKGPPKGAPDWTGRAQSTQEGDPTSSFMNYPHKVPGFFSSFDYRFENYEIQFVRHAPQDFVEMGGSDAGKDHAFKAGREAPYSPFSFAVAVNRQRAVFEFMEPVSLTLTLTNRSDQPQLINDFLLREGHDLTLVIQSRNGRARQWQPYASPCTFGGVTVLPPGESVTSSLFASAGPDGWYLAEPGAYDLYAVLDCAHRTVLAPPVTLRIAYPQSQDEDHLAQNFFSDEVGRALFFGGTHVMTSAVETLREAADRLQGRAVARHALLALAQPLMQHRKTLRLPEGQSEMSPVAADGGTIEVIKAKPDEARQLLHAALVSESGTVAAETFGRLTYNHHLEKYATWLAESGDKVAGEKIRAMLRPAYDTRYEEKSSVESKGNRRKRK